MKIIKTRDVKTPSRGTSGSAGFDWYVPNDMEWESKIVRPGESILIDSGIKARVPDGFMLCAFNKSGIATKRGLQVGACVVDSDYTGNIHLHVANVSNKDSQIIRGEKLVQFILVPVSLQDIEVVDQQELFADFQTERGDGGFGSTGLK